MYSISVSLSRKLAVPIPAETAFWTMNWLIVTAALAAFSRTVLMSILNCSSSDWTAGNASRTWSMYCPNWISPSLIRWPTAMPCWMNEVSSNSTGITTSTTQAVSVASAVRLGRSPQRFSSHTCTG